MDSIPQKRCSKCGETKPLTEFPPAKKSALGVNAWCRACHRAYAATRYRTDPELRERIKAYDRREDVKARHNARNREKYRTSEEYRAYKRDKLLRRYHTNTEYRKKHFAWSSASLHRRRARKQANGGSYTAAEWKALCAHYGHRCLCCGSAGPLTVDHVVPLALGGSNDISNLQPLCLSCNARKGARIADYRPDQLESGG